MTTEQWFGVALMAIGVYYIVCSVWARGFILYRLQTSLGIFSEHIHKFYFLLGCCAALMGTAKVLGYM